MIQAPEAWNMRGGNKGQGIVVFSISTGARSTHEGLASNFRRSYNWFDATASASKTPVDSDGLGTHVMGVMVGSKGIGVAPEANWITCRACVSGVCKEGDIVACGKWIACPTLPDGRSPNCDQSPHIVLNTWDVSPGSTWYNGIFHAWDDVFAIPFFGIGDKGPSCGTARSPDNIDEVISVGCTNYEDHICRTLSRGPSSGKTKPDLVAPGDKIRSAWKSGDSEYHVLSGTSMSATHVAETAAIVFSFNSTYDGALHEILTSSAERNTLGPADTCGGIPSAQFPNNVYG